MKKLSRRFDAGIAIALLALFLTSPAQSAESDLSVTNTPPASIPLGLPFTVTIGYANSGPDTAISAYVDSDFVPPTGLKVFMDNLNNGDGSLFDQIQSSAAGTDTNGNVPKLYWDDFYCEHVMFQLHGASGPDATPILPLTPGGSGSFTYDLTLPIEGTKTGTVEITEPASVIDSWTLNDPAGLWVGLGAATAFDRYSSTTCEKLVGTTEEDVCDYIDDNCWGTKVSHLETPIDAEFELVNDGSADPSLGCQPLIGFTPGSIAVIRRGTCEFGLKGFNAEVAGAVAVFMVNDGRCLDFPASDVCTISMGSGDLGALVTIPVVMVSVEDGEPVIDAIAGGQTVRGVFGGSSMFSTHSMVFSADPADTDPDNTNDIAATTTEVIDQPIFVDGFESGDTGDWSQTNP